MTDEGTPAGPDFVETPGDVWVAETQLRSGAVTLVGAIMQNVTHIAPAIAAFFFTQTIVGFSGAHAPLAYLIGFIIVLALGMCLVQLAKKFPSAGGYYTYVSRTVGPRLGLLTGWMYALYSPIVAGPVLAFLGLIFEGEFQSNWRLDVVPLVDARDRRPPDHHADRLLRDLALDRTIVVVGAARVPDRARAGTVGPRRSGAGRLHVQRFSSELQPG